MHHLKGNNHSKLLKWMIVSFSWRRAPGYYHTMLQYLKHWCLPLPGASPPAVDAPPAAAPAGAPPPAPTLQIRLPMSTLVRAYKITTQSHFMSEQSLQWSDTSIRFIANIFKLAKLFLNSKLCWQHWANPETTCNVSEVKSFTQPNS